MSISVTPDQIALAMKNHVISKRNPVEDKIVDVVMKKPAAKPTASIKNKHIPGVKNQQCKFCRGFFEKVNLHSPYCSSNPKRRAGSRAVSPLGNAKIEKLATELFDGKSPAFILQNIEKFNAWVSLTKEILESK